MNKLKIAKIDLCIAELEELRETMENDTHRIKSGPWAEKSEYQRIELSKSYINQVRRMVTRRLMDLERSHGSSYSYELYEYRRNLIESEKKEKQSNV